MRPRLLLHDRNRTTGALGVVDQIALGCVTPSGVARADPRASSPPVRRSRPREHDVVRPRGRYLSTPHKSQVPLRRRQGRRAIGRCRGGIRTKPVTSVPAIPPAVFQPSTAPTSRPYRSQMSSASAQRGMLLPEGGWARTRTPAAATTKRPHIATSSLPVAARSNSSASDSKAQQPRAEGSDLKQRNERGAATSSPKAAQGCRTRCPTRA